MQEDPAPQVQFRIEVPEGVENGCYTNFLSIWSSPHDFTLDFAVTGQAEPGEPGGPLVVPARVVSRIKVPLTMAEDILRVIATQVSQFEEAAGRIRKPGDDRPFNPEGP